MWLNFCGPGLRSGWCVAILDFRVRNHYIPVKKNIVLLGQLQWVKHVTIIINSIFCLMTLDNDNKDSNIIGWPKFVILSASIILTPMSTYLCQFKRMSRCKILKVRYFLINTRCATENFHRTPGGSRYQTPWQDRWEESGIEMSDRRGVPGSILQGIYGCADVCICQVLTVNFWAGRREPSVAWELSGWAVLMAAWGYWKARGMCVWATNSCSLRVMTTCVLSAWFTDVHDLSSLLNLWQDRQDAVNILNTPYDRCFHWLCL